MNWCSCTVVMQLWSTSTCEGYQSETKASFWASFFKSMAMAVARSPCHHVLKHRLPFGIPLATAAAIAVPAHFDMAYVSCTGMLDNQDGYYVSCHPILLIAWPLYRVALLSTNCREYLPLLSTYSSMAVLILPILLSVSIPLQEHVRWYLHQAVD